MDQEVKEAVDSAKAAQERAIPELEQRIKERRTRVYENRLWSLKEEAAELHALANDLIALDKLKESTEG